MLAVMYLKAHLKFENQNRAGIKTKVLKCPQIVWNSYFNFHMVCHDWLILMPYQPV